MRVLEKKSIVAIKCRNPYCLFSGKQHQANALQKITAESKTLYRKMF